MSIPFDLINRFGATLVSSEHADTLLLEGLEAPERTRILATLLVLKGYEIAPLAPNAVSIDLLSVSSRLSQTCIGGN